MILSISTTKRHHILYTSVGTMTDLVSDDVSMRYSKYSFKF